MTPTNFDVARVAIAYLADPLTTRVKVAEWLRTQGPFGRGAARALVTGDRWAVPPRATA